MTLTPTKAKGESIPLPGLVKTHRPFLFLAAASALLLSPVSASAQGSLHVDTSGNPTASLNLGDAHVTGTLDPARLPRDAAFRTLNVSAQALFSGPLNLPANQPITLAGGDISGSILTLGTGGVFAPLALPAGQGIRRNAAGTAFEAYPLNSGDGSALTNLNAAAITTGTVPSRPPRHRHPVQHDHACAATARGVGTGLHRQHHRRHRQPAHGRQRGQRRGYFRRCGTAPGAQDTSGIQTGDRNASGQSSGRCRPLVGDDQRGWHDHRTRQRACLLGRRAKSRRHRGHRLLRVRRGRGRCARWRAESARQRGLRPSQRRFDPRAGCLSQPVHGSGSIFVLRHAQQHVERGDHDLLSRAGHGGGRSGCGQVRGRLHAGRRPAGRRLRFHEVACADRSGRYLAEKQATVAADSVTGNNANAGTLYAPKPSLAQTLSTGTVFGLYRGSLFATRCPSRRSRPRAGSSSRTSPSVRPGTCRSSPPWTPRPTARSRRTATTPPIPTCGRPRKPSSTTGTATFTRWRSTLPPRASPPSPRATGCWM